MWGCLGRAPALLTVPQVSLGLVAAAAAVFAFTFQSSWSSPHPHRLEPSDEQRSLPPTCPSGPKASWCPEGAHPHPRALPPFTSGILQAGSGPGGTGGPCRQGPDPRTPTPPGPEAVTSAKWPVAAAFSLTWRWPEGAGGQQLRFPQRLGLKCACR